jgi:phosphate transport system permease protein
LRATFPEVTSRRDKRKLYRLLSIGAGDVVQGAVIADPSLIGQTKTFSLPLSDDMDLLIKGLIDRNLPEQDRVISDQELSWLDMLTANRQIEAKFAWQLLLNGDSREAEMAGLKGAFVGSLLTILVTLLVSFPVGVLAAIYLQEMAPKNRLTALIEVNTNNLAAVPSIVFGLLGLAVFIGFFQMPRSAPLVGGLVLALMTLPTIIIATRASLASVPPSIRQGAMALGASRIQVIMHHVLPLAMPGILTGTIIGLAQAAGETAPLLMIGMMAFIVDTPTDVTAKATVLPAQIYMWANNPERAFVARTSAGIVVLLSFLLVINALAIILRKRFEKRW